MKTPSDYISKHRTRLRKKKCPSTDEKAVTLESDDIKIEAAVPKKKLKKNPTKINEIAVVLNHNTNGLFMDEEKKIDDAVVLNHNTYGLIMDEEKKIDDTEVLMNDAEDDLEEDIEKIVSKSGVNIEAVLSENGFTKQYHQPAETQSVFGENLEEANIEVLIHDRQKELASIDNKITNYLCNNTFENSECMEGKVPDGVVNDKLLDESKKLKAAIMNNIKKLSDDDSLPDMPKGISRNYDQKVQEMELKMLEKMLASDDDDSLPEMPLGISRRYDTKGNNKVDSVGVKNIATVGLGTNLEVETFGCC